jgi:hypothetical protein
MPLFCFNFNNAVHLDWRFPLGRKRDWRLGTIDRVVGKTLSMLRRSEEMSLENLADHLGVTIGQLESYEKGLVSIPANRLFLAEDLFRCGCDFFFLHLHWPEIEIE